MELSQIKNVTVIGSGIMGHGIGQTFALGGYGVTLNDISDEILKKAIQQIRFNLDTFLEFGITTPKKAKEALSRIKTDKDLKRAVKESDFVVEVLPEVMELKKRIFKELNLYCPSHTIIASNTSGLSLTEMASETKRQDKVVIAHWWNPPHIIPLVEIVKGRYTSDQTVDLVYQLLTAIGKRPVKILKEVPGFLGNRLQFALYREALACLEEGIATAEDIDTAVKGSFGFRLPTLGPLETSDFGGLDTFLNVAYYLFKEINRSTEPPDILKEKVKQGKLGIKTGEGFYFYSPKKAQERIRERDRQFLQRLKCLYLRDRVGRSFK
jgi:3-hydroxybutyryl-CoA dehydrogenase